MTADAETKRIIGRWLVRLSAITRQQSEEPLTPEHLADMADLLSRDLPSGAFTTDSLHAVSHGHPWFPSYPECSERLGEWWSANMPMALRGKVQRGSDLGLKPADQRWVDFWDKRYAEVMQGWTNPLVKEDRNAPRYEIDAALANLASCIKAHAPEAYDVIASRRQAA